MRRIPLPLAFATAFFMKLSTPLSAQFIGAFVCSTLTMKSPGLGFSFCSGGIFGTFADDLTTTRPAKETMLSPKLGPKYRTEYSSRLLNLALLSITPFLMSPDLMIAVIESAMVGTDRLAGAAVLGAEEFSACALVEASSLSPLLPVPFFFLQASASSSLSSRQMTAAFFFSEAAFLLPSRLPSNDFVELLLVSPDASPLFSSSSSSPRFNMASSSLASSSISC
mmetsp:Transcript_3414/g.9695  ORF Transcript_3414/g.9695 Transcript_3414/m.9695 type:complete len:224 (+) Transcript_3414:389-1060(+)